VSDDLDIMLPPDPRGSPRLPLKTVSCELVPKGTVASLRAERDRLHRALRRCSRQLLQRDLDPMIDGKWARHLKHLRLRESIGWGRCPSNLARDALPDCPRCHGTGWMSLSPTDPATPWVCSHCRGSGKEKR